MMTGGETAIQEANKQEATEKVARKALEKSAAQEKTTKAKEPAIDDEMLVGVASENDSNSEVREIVFSTPISPHRIMLPPRKPTIPERSFTLVHRTPEKAAGGPRRTHSAFKHDYRETSPVATTPPAPAEIPASTAPARLDGRERQAGKNSRYNEAMAIERGRGRGGVVGVDETPRYSGGTTYTPSQLANQPVAARSTGRSRQ
jgi:hypothetical protein